MKFKLKVDVKDIVNKINPEVEVPNVALDIETECTLEELRGLYELQKQAFDEVPGIAVNFINKLKDVVPAYQSLEGVVNNYHSSKLTQSIEEVVSE